MLLYAWDRDWRYSWDMSKRSGSGGGKSYGYSYSYSWGGGVSRTTLIVAVTVSVVVFILVIAGILWYGRRKGWFGKNKKKMEMGAGTGTKLAHGWEDQDANARDIEPQQGGGLDDFGLPPSRALAGGGLGYLGMSRSQQHTRLRATSDASEAETDVGELDGTDVPQMLENRDPCRELEGSSGYRAYTPIVDKEIQLGANSHVKRKPIAKLAAV